MSKEINNDPFKGFVSDSAVDGVAVVEEKPAAKADDAAGADGAPAGKSVAGDAVDVADAGGDGKEADGAGDDEAGDGEDAADDEAGEEADEGAEGEGEGEAEEEAEPAKKPKKSVAERIGELTRARREAERRAADAERRLQALEQKPLTAEKPGAKGADKGPPKPDDYPMGEVDAKYIADLVNYHAEKRIAEHEAAQNEQRQTEAAQRHAEKLKSDRDAVYAKGAEKYDDFEEVVVESIEADEWPLSKTLGDLALSSEVGADILYHLASNPKEAKQVFGKSQIEQAAYFGRLEAKFAAAAAKPKPKPKESKAPKPPANPPRGGSGKTAADANGAVDFATFEAAVKASQKGAARR